MSPDSRLIIESIDVWPVDVDLSDPFVISRGAMATASIAFVRVRLAGGTEGFGEIAPFTALTQETREGSIAAARRLGADLNGRSCAEWESLARMMSAAAPGEPAARCGLECALVDALARSRGETLFDHWRGLGGAWNPKLAPDVVAG